MGAIKITGFLGEIPRTAERLLPDTAAQEAENVNLTSGEIRPVRPAKTAFTPAGEGPFLAAYRAVYGESEKWRAWPIDVDVAKAPFDVEVEPRYYWTGDGPPRYATFTSFGTTDYALGLTAPTAKPASSAAGGVGTTVDRTYCYTFYQPATGEESAPSPVADIASGKVDGTWTISNFSGAPANSGTYTGVFASGVTTCTSPSAHNLRTGDLVVINSVELVATVTSATVFKVTGDYSAYTAWARDAVWNTAGLYQRLYRTSGTAATFQLVAERAVATGNWTDTLTDAQILGDELISADWQLPPENLRGLIALPNGALCGFAGNLLCFSEPYQPHAWPLNYRYGTDFPIVSIANYGTTVVAGTSAYPFVFTGNEPAVVAPERVDNAWPCLSKRSMASVGDGVVYSTTYGVAYVGLAGPTIFTKSLFTREEWQPLNPSSMVCAYSEGRLFIAYTPVGQMTRTLIVSPGEASSLVRYNQSPAELYADPSNGLLYQVGSTVDLWDAGEGLRMVFNWLSKEIELPEPVNFGAAKVEFASLLSDADRVQAQANYVADLAFNQVIIDSKDQVGAYNDDDFNAIAVDGSHLIVPRLASDWLSLTLYSRDGEFSNTTVFDDQAFRLPSGFKSDILSIRLTGNVRVKSVKLAESMIGLKQA